MHRWLGEAVFTRQSSQWNSTFLARRELMVFASMTRRSHEMETAIPVLRTILQCIKAVGTCTISWRSGFPKRHVSQRCRAFDNVLKLRVLTPYLGESMGQKQVSQWWRVSHSVSRPRILASMSQRSDVLRTSISMGETTL